MRPRFTISLERSTLIFSYPQAGRPITPSFGGKADMATVNGVMSASDKKTKGGIKIPQRSSPGLKHPAGSLRGDLGRPQMVIEDIGQLGNGLPAETAIGGEPEFRQILSHRCEPLRKARHVVNGAQIDAGASRLKLAQR